MGNSVVWSGSTINTRAPDLPMGTAPVSQNEVQNRKSLRELFNGKPLSQRILDGIGYARNAQNNKPRRLVAGKSNDDLASSIAKSVMGSLINTPTAQIILELQGPLMCRVEWIAVRTALASSMKARTDIGCLARLLEDIVIDE